MRASYSKAMFLIVLATVWNSGTAIAQSLTCNMTLECLSGEECAATEFTFSLKNRRLTELLNATGDIQVEAAFAVLTTDAETIRGVLAKPTETSGAFPSAFYSMPSSTAHMVSIAQTGAAVYTMQIAQDAFAVTYSGQCEELS